MTGDAASSSTPDGLERLDYQDGQMLDATEFRVEQQYFVDLIRLHTQAYFSAGVAYGLSVGGLVAKDGRYQVTIAPGLGVDDLGHHVILPRPKNVTLPRTSDIAQPSAFDTGGGAPPNTGSNAATDTQAASLAGTIDLFLRYQLTQQVLPDDGGIKRLRLIEAPMVVVRAAVKVSDLLVPYYFDDGAQPLMEIPGQALGFRLVRIAGAPPAFVADSTQRSALRSATPTPGSPSVPLPPPLILRGTGALSAGRATVTVPNWPAYQHLGPTLAPQVWPYLSTPVPATVQVSQVVASQLSSQGTFEVVALDGTNPTQPFSWELRLTT